MNALLVVPLLLTLPIHADVAVSTQITTTGGPTFIILTRMFDQIVAPIDDFANNMQGLVTHDAATTANAVASDAGALWAYLSYGSNVLPGLVSLGVLITLFFVVMLVKAIMSLIKYLKQLVAQWV